MKPEDERGIGLIKAWLEDGQEIVKHSSRSGLGVMPTSASDNKKRNYIHG